MNDRDLCILRYQNIHKSDVVNFLRLKWINLSETDVKNRFECRFEMNPYSKPVIFLAYFKDMLVGFRGFVVQHFEVYNELLTVFSPVDAIVHPEFRRLGIFNKLNKAFIAYLNESVDTSKTIVLNLSSNRYSTPGYLKLGWHVTDWKLKFNFRLSVQNLLRLLLVFKPENKINSRNISYLNYKIEITNQQKRNEMTNLSADKEKDKEIISKLRDRAYFHWRYGLKAERHHYVYCYKDDNLMAYLIIKKISRIHYSVEEYYCLDSVLLKILIKTAVRELHVPVIRLLSINKQGEILSRALGFLAEPKLMLKLLRIKRMPCLVRPAKALPTEEDFFIHGLDLRKSVNWELSLSDYH